MPPHLFDPPANLRSTLSLPPQKCRYIRADAQLDVNHASLSVCLAVRHRDQPGCRQMRKDVHLCELCPPCWQANVQHITHRIDASLDAATCRARWSNAYSLHSTSSSSRQCCLLYCNCSTQAWHSHAYCTQPNTESAYMCALHQVGVAAYRMQNTCQTCRSIILGLLLPLLQDMICTANMSFSMQCLQWNCTHASFVTCTYTHPCNACKSHVKLATAFLTI